jgi:3-oxoacyl-[acyl-carrier protein] reductase
MSQLEGRVAVVTGGGRGLGRAYCETLAREGASVVAADIRETAETVGTITAAGGRALGMNVDIADMASCQAMAEKAIAEFGRIDVLVNNAALYGDIEGGRFDQIPEEQWDKTMAVNVRGVWNGCKACVPAMREAGSGSVINIASLAAVYGMPFGLHYATSKAAVIGMTRALARELGRNRIRVNAVAPSAVLTEGTDEFFGEKKDKLLQVVATGQSLQQNLTTDDLVGTILYLASDASKMVTGQTLMVDGGTVFL